MKLFNKYTRINLISMIVVFLLSGSLFYWLISLATYKQADKLLQARESSFKNYISQNHKLPGPSRENNLEIQITPIVGQDHTRLLETISRLNPVKNESVNFRKLTFTCITGTQAYQVVMEVSLEASEEFSELIMTYSIWTIMLIIIASLIINRVVLKRLWKPFYNTLGQLQILRIGQGNTLHFPRSGINEFDFMNEALESSINKAEVDYLMLKEFTENASHEIQTPLAIIQSKLDLLVKDGELSESQGNNIQSAYSSIRKLSRLTNSLLLISKIENGQFSETKQLDLKNRLDEKLELFQELVENKNITISLDLHSSLITINPTASDILINNLLSNALNHNKCGGTIAIHLAANKLSILNSGADHGLDLDRIFTRFYKSEVTGSGNGLGLSIINHICRKSGIEISYSFRNRLHAFDLSW